MIKYNKTCKLHIAPEASAREHLACFGSTECVYRQTIINVLNYFLTNHKQECLNITDPAIALQSCYTHTHTHTHGALSNPASLTGDGIESAFDFRAV